VKEELQDDLVNGGDCHLHYHQSDRTPRQDTIHGLQLVTRTRVVSTSQSILRDDDIVEVSALATVTLPIANNGREFQIVMTGAGNVTVQLSGTDLIYGNTSVLMNVQGMSLRFKAITGGWILI